MVIFSERDKLIIDMYKEMFNKNSQTLMHIFLGMAAKCLEENHVEKLKKSEGLYEELLRLQHHLRLYQERYGPLTGLVRRKPPETKNISRKNS